MTIRILYFAGLRETLGCSSEELDLPPNVSNIEELRIFISERGEPWSAIVKTKNLKSAVNQVMVTVANPIKNGDEIAFFPPVTGG